MGVDRQFSAPFVRDRISVARPACRIDWNTFQRVTRYLKRRTQVDLDEPIAANKATYRPGMEAHATNAPYRRSGVSQ